MNGVRLIQRAYKRRIRRATNEALQAHSRVTNQHRLQVVRLVDEVTHRCGPALMLGQTRHNQELGIPLDDAFAHSLIVGASGAGKSYCALGLINQILRGCSAESNIGFGLLDAKGELFQKVLLYIHAYLFSLDASTREAIKDRIRILDFSNEHGFAPYNILQPKPFLADELLVSNRIETISEQFAGLAELSVRMRTILKYMFLLMVEFHLPLSFFDELCSQPALLSVLVAKSQNDSVRSYFGFRFERETTSTLLALRQRIDALLMSDGVRLSLSAGSAPDFTALQDQGFIVLINTAGPNITRGISELLQGLILSDIKQSVFQRTNPNTKFLWFFDEAQNLYKSSANREHMVDLLTMARSFRSFFALITQSLTSAVHDADVLNSLLANVRWILMLRSTLRDAELIAPAISLTGRLARPRTDPFESPKYMSPAEELKTKLKAITRLPDRQAYCWLKTRIDTAIQLTTSYVALPHEIAGVSTGRLAEFMASEKIGGGIERQEIMARLSKLRDELFNRPDRESASITSERHNRGNPQILRVLEEAYASLDSQK